MISSLKVLNEDHSLTSERYIYFELHSFLSLLSPLNQLVSSTLENDDNLPGWMLLNTEWFTIRELFFSNI